MSGKEGRREGGIVIRTGGGTTQNCLSRRLPRCSQVAKSLSRTHALAGIRSPWGVIMISLAFGGKGVFGAWGLGASSATDSTQLAQRAADLHTVTTPRRTSRLPCSGWCGRVGVWARGHWARGFALWSNIRPSHGAHPGQHPLRSMMSRRQGCFAALNLSSGAVGV